MTVKVTVEHIDKDDFRLANGKSADSLNPKEMLLYAAACCAGKTVTGLLGRERLSLKKLEITMQGELDTPTVTAHSVYNSFRITYNLQCSSPADESKVREWVQTADSKYCGTLKMMRKIAPVKSEIHVGREVEAW